jgi:hypothetical protein
MRRGAGCCHGRECVAGMVLRKLSLTLLLVVTVVALLGVPIPVGGTITSYHVLAA